MGLTEDWWAQVYHDMDTHLSACTNLRLRLTVKYGPSTLTPGQQAMVRARAAKVQRKAEVAARLTDRRLTWKRPGVWQRACRAMGIRGY